MAMQMVDDLVGPILCTAARLALASTPNPICPRARCFPRPLPRADLLAPFLAALSPLLHVTLGYEIHLLLVLAFPNLYSLHHVCARGHVALLYAWRRLLSHPTRRHRVLDRLLHSPDLLPHSSCIDVASALGHLNVLDWWLLHGPHLKAALPHSSSCLDHSHMAVHLAVLNARPAVVDWWRAHPSLLKLDFHQMLLHAIDFDAGDALHRWLDYHLPVPSLPLPLATARDALLRCFHSHAWSVLAWWKRALAQGLVPPVDTFDPNPHPLVAALESGTPRVFDWWVDAGLPLPNGFHSWVLDAASAGGLVSVLRWFTANHHAAQCYSTTAMDAASYGVPIQYTRARHVTCEYPVIPADRRLAVLDWWVHESGRPLKYSPRAAVAMLDQCVAYNVHVRVRGNPSVYEVLIPVLQWWVDSGLEVDWTVSTAQRDKWDPEINQWWDRNILKMSADNEC